MAPNMLSLDRSTFLAKEKPESIEKYGEIYFVFVIQKYPVSYFANGLVDEQVWHIYTYGNCF